MKRLPTIRRITIESMVRFYSTMSFADFTSDIRRFAKNGASPTTIAAFMQIRNLAAEGLPDSKIAKSVDILQTANIIKELIAALSQSLRNDSFPSPEYLWREMQQLYYMLIPFMRPAITFEEFSLYAMAMWIEAFKEAITRLNEQ